jgi:hypothetical protein
VGPLPNVIERSIHTRNTLPNKEGSMVAHNTLKHEKHHKTQEFRVCLRKTPKKKKITHQLEHPKFLK